MPKAPAKQYPLTQTDLSKLIGVSLSVMNRHTQTSHFPEPFDQTPKGPRWLGPDVLRWYVEHGAPEKYQRELLKALSSRFGVGVDIPEDYETAKEQLDIRLKAHKVSRAIGDCVSFQDIRHIVGELAREIRNACEKVNAATGRDVSPLFGTAFDNFEHSLREAQSRAVEVDESVDQ